MSVEDLLAEGVLAHQPHSLPVGLSATPSSRPTLEDKKGVVSVPSLLPRSLAVDVDVLEVSEPTSVCANIYWMRDTNSSNLDSLGSAATSPGFWAWQQNLVKDMLGVYHIGIQVHNVEFTYGNSQAPDSRYIGGDASGVCMHSPQKAGANFTLRESIELGKTTLSAAQVEGCAGFLGREQFHRAAHDHINNSCVDFCQSMAAKLGVSGLPVWCYRGTSAARLLQNQLGFKGASASSPQTQVVANKKVMPDEASLESLMRTLFGLHDLKGNGVLEEEELIKLNEKISMLHYGKDINKAEVREKYSDLFRRKLDKDGNAVPYSTFRTYMVEVLKELDTDPAAQEMILEQWIAEAECARTVFHCRSFQSISDEAFLANIPFSEDMVFGAKDSEKPS
eukprot:CAMPEP_0178395014 /NCGR_PEP_ID=MMETSP0689_2-20121128/13003_1 /TAXON_ID=160604 /ORGANISM="Amphidinium massartii, Strain CS-259" /LENGTH=392 /DNA_ID=CAMNT_0020015661 /DNA_START=60 /DNA_END=1235 /DNA_ORIENTATION=+